jgi:uncharacterized membrane protein (DUF2068 family)
MNEPRGKSATLRVIAFFKLLEALPLILAGLGALGLLNPAWQHTFVEWLDQLSLREGRRLLSEVASKAIDSLSATSAQRLVLIAIGCFAYGSVFVAEAVGLWLGKRWAEYLTTVVTASLLPFEVVELMHHVSAARAATLLTNLLVVGYLVWRLVRDREKKEGV